MSRLIWIYAVCKSLLLSPVVVKVNILVLSAITCFKCFSGFFFFFCVEVLQPSQPNGVMSSAVSLPNHTFTGQA